MKPKYRKEKPSQAKIRNVLNWYAALAAAQSGDNEKIKNIEAFEKSAALAELRNVPANKILKSKADIDRYFGGE